MYTHSSLKKSAVHVKPELSFQEACLLEIKMRGDPNAIRLFVSQSDGDKKNNDLNRLLLSIGNNNYSHVCVVGDFYFRDINWETCSTVHKEESKEQKFIETLRDCYFHQHNLENSRRRGANEPSLIDLILSDEEMQVSDVLH